MSEQHLRALEKSIRDWGRVWMTLPNARKEAVAFRLGLTAHTIDDYVRHAERGEYFSNPGGYRFGQGSLLRWVGLLALEMDSNHALVRSMHKMYRFPAPDAPTRLDRSIKIDRIRMMQEELTEYAMAVDLEDEADALLDLVVFALGTAVMMGLPWEPMFAEVMRANFSKVREETDRGEFDLIKPDGWTAPQLAKFLGAD